MKTMRILLIIIVMNILLIAVTNYGIAPKDNDVTYQNIYDQGNTDLQTAHESFISDENIIGAGTIDKEYDQTTLDTKRSQTITFGTFKEGLTIGRAEQEAYQNGDLLTRIVLDAIMYIRSLSLIIVFVLGLMFFKNRKTD